ncbi:VOC family protein [Flexivirga caeni]|uniref:VOC family protein n=1 Tax=Flexivirga caeni TaxID=2294115 RepID=A0A3M9MKU1_9MICO|nr:VOC family protein [Flexivirga caeni]RNI25288.1 VOC family protein [Flexivirga caeni]
MPVEVGAIAFDCTDVLRTARFWSELLGRQLDDGADEFFASIGREDPPGRTWFFMKADARPKGKNPIHLDLVGADWDAEVARAESLGAQRVAQFEEFGTAWVTFADPEGNLFDIGRG